MTVVDLVVKGNGAVDNLDLFVALLDNLVLRGSERGTHDLNLALGALDADGRASAVLAVGVGRNLDRGGGDTSSLVLGEVAEHARRLVGAGPVLVHDGEDLGGLLLAFGFGLYVIQRLEYPGEGVDTQIEQCTTGEVEVHHAVSVGEVDGSVLIALSKRQVGDGSVNLANGTRRDELANLDTEREVTGPDSLHEEQILLLGLGNELLGLGSVDSQGLLAKHVLAGLEGEHGILEVVAVRGSDVDDVDIGVGNKLSVRAICFGGAGTADLLYEALSAVAGAGGGNGDNLVADVADFADGGVGEEVTAEGWSVVSLCWQDQLQD